MAYNDIFGKNASDYWCNEGCNKRMQKYKVISNCLKFFKYVLGLIFLIYLLYLALQVLTLLLTDVNMYNKLIFKETPTYSSCFLGILNQLKICGVIYLMLVLMNEYFFGNMTIKNIYKRLLLFLGISPTIMLVVINFDIYSTGLVTIFLAVLYIFIIFCINLLRSKIDFLYDLSTGKFINKTEETIPEQKEDKKIKENNFKNKKRRK